MPVSRKHPATYIASIGTFPQGPYRRETPSEAYLAAALARRLKEKMKGESIRYIAKKADLSPQTLVNILHGKTWPDLLTIARLENALEGKTMGKRTPQKTELDSLAAFTRHMGFEPGHLG